MGSARRRSGGVICGMVGGVAGGAVGVVGGVTCDVVDGVEERVKCEAESLTHNSCKRV